MSLMLRDAVLADGRRVDVRLDGDRIGAIEARPDDVRAPSGRLPDPRTASAPAAGLHYVVDAARALPADGGTLELGGALLLPALVNGHAHLDKTFVGTRWIPHRPGASVQERIAIEHELRAEVEVPVVERGAALAEQMIRFGTGAVRTHVDIDPGVGLDSLHQVLELRERFRERLDIQVVAFPQSGILRAPGVADLLERAVRAGADVIGGLDPIGIDHDAAAALDIVFDLAAGHGTGVDIHLHDLGAAAVQQVDLITERTRATGLAGRVALSHAYGLGSIPRTQARSIGARLAEAGVSVMTNGPAGPMPPVVDLRAEGVDVFAGSDNVRDAWSPVGDGDMLAIARRIAHHSGLQTDEDLATALDLTTAAAATALALPGYGLYPGARADLLVLDSTSPADAIAANPTGRLTFHGGTPVAGLVTGSVDFPGRTAT